MKHKMLMAYVRIYTQQSIFFHKLSPDHQNDDFEACLRLSMLLIAASLEQIPIPVKPGFWSISQMWLLLTQA